MMAAAAGEAQATAFGDPLRFTRRQVARRGRRDDPLARRGEHQAKIGTQASESPPPAAGARR
jgi:hypothetical protein